MQSIEEAVQADVERWGLGGTALAASALDLARALDDPEVKPTPRSMLHAQLRMVLVELAKLAPEEEEVDGIDELARRRSERRGA
jgi:hypothetical protein